MGIWRAIGGEEGWSGWHESEQTHRQLSSLLGSVQKLFLFAYLLQLSNYPHPTPQQNAASICMVACYKGPCNYLGVIKSAKKDLTDAAIALQPS